MTHDNEEIFISIDVETSGPIPGKYSMLTIGACLTRTPTTTFECSLKPINSNFDPAALEVTGLSLETLQRTGEDPRTAMDRIRDWIAEVSKSGKPIFVGLNAPFDWSFLNYYLHRFGGDNPFGFTALDIKALYMGAFGCDWTDTRSSRMAERLRPRTKGDHDALHDAQYQAELFELILKAKRDARPEGS